MEALLTNVGPVLAGILTVPVFGFVKQYLTWFDERAASIQQVLVLVTAILLTWLGMVLNVALPTDIALFTEADVGAGLSAVTAFLAHRSRK